MMPTNLARLIDSIERTPGLGRGAWWEGREPCALMALAEAAPEGRKMTRGLAMYGPESLAVYVRGMLAAYYGLFHHAASALMQFNDNLHCDPRQRRDAVLALLRKLRDEWEPQQGAAGYSDAELACAIRAKGDEVAACYTRRREIAGTGEIEALSLSLPATMTMYYSDAVLAAFYGPPPSRRPAPPSLTPEQIDEILSAGATLCEV